MSQRTRAAEESLRALIREQGSAVVAFSGGVDSSLLLRLAADELGSDHVLAVTARGPVHTDDEVKTAERIAASMGVRHLVIAMDHFSIPGFVENSPDRCFLCKQELFDMLWDIARCEGLSAVLEGSNADDADDYRPGMWAAELGGVLHPLVTTGMGKEAIRSLARELGVESADHPSSPCLASRIPFGEMITGDKLRMIEKGESVLRGMGFSSVRVRNHSGVARIEVALDELSRLVQDDEREKVVAALRAAGFSYVTLDLEGFRSGSLNEVPRP